MGCNSGRGSAGYEVFRSPRATPTSRSRLIDESTRWASASHGRELHLKPGVGHHLGESFPCRAVGVPGDTHGAAALELTRPGWDGRLQQVADVARCAVHDAVGRVSQAIASKRFLPNSMAESWVSPVNTGMASVLPSTCTSASNRLPIDLPSRRTGVVAAVASRLRRSTS